MTDLNKDFIKETGFDIFSEIEDKYTVYTTEYVEWLEAKINYTRCSTQLKDKEAMSFDDWLEMNNYTQIKDAVFKDENGKKFKQTTLQIEYYNNISL